MLLFICFFDSMESYAAGMSTQWPALSHETRDWVPDPMARGSRADRLLGTYRSALPWRIAERELAMASPVADVIVAAQEAARVLREQVRVDLSALAGALLRSESVASSKIEQLSARQDEVALSAFGVNPGKDPVGARAVARAVAANLAAMTAAADVPAGVPLTVGSILEMHRVLLHRDTVHGQEAGHIRTVQNWIGGSDHSPRGALFVPPRPELVLGLLDDLAAFASRSDLDPVVVGAVAHAQFETIHPFVDGNGRTGRALVHALWRRLGFTDTTVIPVSTVLLADVDGYFTGLETYRSGDIDSWVTQFAAATAHAAIAAQRLAGEVEELRATWMTEVAPRKGSASVALIDVALRQPVFNFEAVRSLVPGTDRNVYGAIDRLATAGVLVEVTGQGRNRVWFAPDLFALLERFEQSLGLRRRPDTTIL